MKIAITGHSAGIGQALSKIYQQQGHEIVGLSRRNGYNIRSINKIVSMVENCDVFINNAQVGFTQTELLFAVYKLWHNQKGKSIINISSMLTSFPVCLLPGIEMTEYYVQKKSLEEAISQLRNYQAWPKLYLIKPGAVATQPGQIDNPSYANVEQWAMQLIKILDAGHNLDVCEIALGVNYGQ